MKTFACNTNSAPAFIAVASFVPPPGVNELLGMSAEIRVASANLPDWWKHGSGECRGASALTPDFEFTPGACTDFWPGSEQGGSLYSIAAYGPNTARLVVQCGIPIDERGPVSPEQEYNAFKLRLLSANTTGDGSCAGCNTPVSLTLQHIQLIQPPESANDPIISTPLTRNMVYWQAVTPDPPTINSVLPTAGAPGASITIHGTSLSATSAVRFGTISAAFSVVSDVEVTATIPAGAASGPITLETPFGSATSSAITVAPSVRHFLPKQATAGHTIYLSGRNFIDVSTVRFNGAVAPFNIVTNSSITTVVPDAATTGPISVTNPGGTAVTDSVFRVGPIGGALDLSWDDCGLAGAETKTFACNSNTGTPFTMIGSFVPPPGVNRLSGAIADLGVYSETLPDWWKHGVSQCRGGAGLNVNHNFDAGPSTCSNAWVNGVISGSLTYQIGYYGANTARLQLVLSGNEAPVDPNTEYYSFKVNITRNRTVSDGSCNGCETPVRVTLHEIQLTQPAAVGYDPVISIPFHRNTAYWQGDPGRQPRIDSFTPTAGPSGTPVTLRGGFFTGATAVRFRNSPATFTVVSEAEISTSVPAGARTGSIAVTTPHGTGGTDSLFIVNPDIQFFLPRTAPIGHTITIGGTSFTRTTSVKFNGLAASFTVPSDSVIRAVVPAGTTDGPISVTSAGGTDVSDSLFRVGPIPSGTINLSWNDCGLAGIPTQSFACNTNLGTAFTLVGSFVPPPDVIQLVGLAAEIRVASTGNLPDWWKHGSGECRGPSALTTDFDFRGGPTSCADILQGQATGGLNYGIGFYGPNTARIQISCSLIASAGAADPSTEYYAFKAQIQPNKSTGAGSCTGCSLPVSLTLNRIQLFQSAGLGYDPILTAPADRATAYWQTIPGPAPQISEFAPPAGAPGQVVTISGTHFTGASSVRFHTVEASSFTVVSDIRVDATVPVSPRTGPIHVATIQGAGTSDSIFIVPPDLQGFAPRTAPVGYPVRIRGFNFTRASAVSFNGIAATFTVLSDATLEANVPAGAADGPITVTNLAGSDTSDSLFHVGPVPPGTVNLSWDQCGSLGTAIKTFACDSNFGSPFTFVGSFLSPPGIDELTGMNARIRIESSDALPDWWKHGSSDCRGNNGLSPLFDFTGGSACLDPWLGHATGSFAYTVGYDGVNTALLQVSCAVPFANRTATEVGSEYDAFKVRIERGRTTGPGQCAGCDVHVLLTLEEIQLFQPAAVGFDPVLTEAQNRNNIAWQAIPGPLPNISGFSPTAGPPGTVVTIQGTHFTGASRVEFGTVPSSFTTMSDSHIEATVPSTALSGPIEVTTQHGSRASNDIFVVAPRIAHFTPRQAPVGHPITITGENFLHTSSVEFNGLSTSFDILSNTGLRATVPTGATEGPITVTNPGGSDTSDSTFRVGPLTKISNGDINLSWDDCGLAGTESQTFACNVNAGTPFTMVASFRPPSGVEEYLGMSAQIDIGVAFELLPDWWRHGTGQCRSTTGLFTDFNFTSGPFTCNDFFSGAAAGGFAYDVEFGSPNRARFRIQCAVPIENRGPIDPETEYYAFKAVILRSKSTGAGSCTGCTVPACIVLNEIQLFQPPSANFDPQITDPLQRNSISWQGEHLKCSGATPVQASVVTTEAEFDRVRVVWMTGDVDEAAIYRREGDQAWVMVSRLVPDGSHRLTYDDYDVVPGATYSYRLGITLPTGEVFAGETSVTVPGHTVLAMSAVRWDAGSRGVLVSLSLPQASPVTFEIYDLGGRRFVREHLEGLSAGTHDVRIGGARTLRPGMYFARLSQGSAKVTGRFVVVQ